MLIFVEVIAKLAVAVEAYHIDKPYDYRVPEEMTDKLYPGMRVMVPFGNGNRRCEGLVLSLTGSDDSRVLKCIDRILDDKPILTTEQIKLALWMSDRFFCTVYEAVKAMLPAGLWFKDGKRKASDKTISVAVLDIPPEEALILAGQKRHRAVQQANILELLSQIGSADVKEILYFTGASKGSIKALIACGALRLEEYEIFRRPTIQPVTPAVELLLNAEQEVAYHTLLGMLQSHTAEAALLYGVTGSGKTSVYIKLIEETIQQGRDALVLVPEIALTPQLIATFSGYFGDTVAVLHSALGIGERYDEWKRIKSGLVRVVVGTRSAVFAPVANLGLLILDEEQEHTYKSENKPRYHARDIAKYRCAGAGALLLLGSATPSIESMYSAAQGKYALVTLMNRYNERNLPPVIIADMKQELQNGNGGLISNTLLQELQLNISRGEQSILFINRRGTSTLIACPECGFTFTCQRCSVSMTYHSANKRLMCHYCGYSEPMRTHCPSCNGKLKLLGAGTQKVEEELEALLPGVSVIRMDTDTVTLSQTHEKHLTRFKEKNIPILIGTQMVAKGLDFENVTLVGVLSADQMLYISDYRAHERTFSLITQVVGRSGRGLKPGRAVIQTFTPFNDIIRLAAQQDYDGFYERELTLRKLSGSPPYYDLIALTASGCDEATVLHGCLKLKASLLNYFGESDALHILGPAAAAVAKVNNRYRFRITVCCHSSRKIRETIAHIIREFSKDKVFKGVHVYADADPYEI